MGLDLSEKTIRRATTQHRDLIGVGADARRLPFAHGAFDVIVSNWTLDHFQSIDELARAVRELSRVLRRGGQLLLSVDNLANPIVAVRNRLPFRLLNGLGLVLYYVGATCGPRRLGSIVSQAGLSVQETGAIMHCPRVFAVAASGWIDRVANDRGKEAWLRWLNTLEHLGKLPRRFQSGYFIALRATRT